MEMTTQAIETETKVQSSEILTCSNLNNNSQKNNEVSDCDAQSNLRNEASTSKKVSDEMLNSTSKGKIAKAETQKTFGLDSLRRELPESCQERTKQQFDGLFRLRGPNECGRE